MSTAEQSQPKRIYSLNLVSFLLSKGLTYESFSKDEDGKVYFVFGNVGRQVNEYRSSKELQSFLSHYKLVKSIVKSI